MTDHITAAKLTACVPYNSPRGNFLQLPWTPVFEIQLNNVGNLSFLSVPGQEQGTHPKYGFLVHAISALVDLPYTYMRVQWPDGKYLSNVPIDIWSMIQTGRNGRLMARPKYCEPGSVIRMEFGTSQVDDPVNVKVFFEGAILIPA
jgi:hypothetical protein